jgi:hypothetical protein
MAGAGNVTCRRAQLAPSIDMECDEGGQMGYINTSGALVIPLQFSQAGIFRDGLAAVTNWGENSDPTWGYIDRTGRYVWGPVTGYWPQ